MADDNQLTRVFMPSLVSVLRYYERNKGSALTEQEVIAIRDKAVAVLILKSTKTKILKNRGYEDIDPERCWEQWQKVREQIDTNDSAVGHPGP